MSESDYIVSDEEYDTLTEGALGFFRFGVILGLFMGLLWSASIVWMLQGMENEIVEPAVGLFALSVAAAGAAALMYHYAKSDVSQMDDVLEVGSDSAE